jgi:leader peptidase (prepilin peptidase)/N-methyltransferase
VRDSKCPICQTKIRRTDNLPIFSYVNLGGKCRSCSTTIPARYLIAELVVAAIFGSLFLYELVTGCANVPHMRTIHHQGILWIILYPKWPAIGMYFYHVFFMCTLLVLSLMEWDKQPLKLIFTGLLGLTFLLTAAIYHPIQPVPFFEHWPSRPINFSPWIEQLFKLAVGGIIGAVIGRLIGTAFSASRLSILTFAFALTGMVLGWQALLQVTVFFGVLAVAAQTLPKEKSLKCYPAVILLLAVALHHPFWKTIAQCWRS